MTLCAIVDGALDTGYSTGIKVTNDRFAAVSLTPDGFHGDWKYSIQAERRKRSPNYSDKISYS